MIPDAWDIESRENALRLARHLIETGALRYDPQHPCRHGSGLTSPLHLEGRRLLSYPAVRGEVVDMAVRMIDQEIGIGNLDAVAAGEGAGVPWATLVADRLELPFIFVRKEAPGQEQSFKHRIEGRVERGWRVLLVEQLAADGHRKARFAQPLTEAGCELHDVFVLFQYGIFDEIHQHLAPLGITMHALANWWDVLEVVNRGHYLDGEAQGEIHAFLADPRRWKSDAAADAAATPQRASTRR
ncbi:orotate phosphoribosyltransferase [Azospirillum thermophilum]|uniref:Orotate phosphoribosyltransferase n=1 Tax=Azospirillum thermophilum TaxID=2202148 RepID=A0A2S2CTF4_9PROT|nr:orotate phosphoribosyltransferase [Azospirillum thermophilum]AWK87758.1 orotate phosphoribosyltransferase [Azospirillum thermophilum]